ncbi:amino acid dehydrogenase family protein [Actinidia rufa]|uniref:glutamate dehydrogenase (NADP(+)) n=1 Tax=Actinidia rufa TaxID=165716 RepID=A0A7J0FEL0_9ERIC|nr:amino acid dehydrogenase family protein [Actinidia rufa]
MMIQHLPTLPLSVAHRESLQLKSMDDSKQMVMVSQLSSEDHDLSKMQPLKRKKKVVKRWREEWADTYKWAYVDVKEGTARIFCSVCREYGRKHRRNPYGNEGSRNMQMSALEEHNNSLLHKEALRLQMASNDKVVVDKPIYVKALMSKTAGTIVEAAVKRDPQEFEFIQCVQEAVHALERVIAKNSHYVNMMERLLEPERMIIFRVPWVDDRGSSFSTVDELKHRKVSGFPTDIKKSALSPYKLGGAAGGSDFDTKGKSDNEIMRFCQSFMNELYRYLGPDKDLPSEEMGVGAREMGYMFGQYRRLASHVQGSFTGPRIIWSGSSLRTEATGYGLVFFAQLILADMNKELKGLRCIVTGSGKNCDACSGEASCFRRYSHYSIRRMLVLSTMTKQNLGTKGVMFHFLVLHKNEIDQSDAINLVNSGCRLLVEGSNMPCTSEAVDVLRKANVLMAPAIAAGAGGVAAGELELINLSPEEFESKLQEAMKQTYQRTLKAATDFGYQKESPE